MLDPFFWSLIYMPILDLSDLCSVSLKFDLKKKSVLGLLCLGLKIVTTNAFLVMK